MVYNRYERVKGGGEFLTAREYYTIGGQAHKIPRYHPEVIHNHIVDAFWDLKCGDIDYRIKKSDFDHVLLNRVERNIIKEMDKSFLIAVAEERKKASK